MTTAFLLLHTLLATPSAAPPPAPIVTHDTPSLRHLRDVLGVVPVRTGWRT